MAVDAVYGVTKVHGFVATGYESLTSNFEFVTIVTKVPIRTYAQMIAVAVDPTAPTTLELAAAATSQGNLDKLIQIVSLRGQPVIMGSVTGTTTFTVILAIEHPHAWQSATSGEGDPRSNEDLLNRLKLDGIGYGFGANLNSIDDSSSLAVTFSNVLT